MNNTSYEENNLDTLLCDICDMRMKQLLPIKFTYCPGCFYIKNNNNNSIQYNNTIYSLEFYREFVMYIFMRYIETNKEYINKNKNEPLRILLIYNNNEYRNNMLNAFSYVCDQIKNFNDGDCYENSQLIDERYYAGDEDTEVDDIDDIDDVANEQVINNIKGIVYNNLNDIEIQIEPIGVGDLDVISFTNFFNIITAQNVIEYLDDPKMFIRTCKDLIGANTNLNSNSESKNYSNNLILIQSSYNNFILDKQFNWTKSNNVCKNIFNANSMKLLTNNCGLYLNNVEIIDTNYCIDEVNKYGDYLFEISNTISDFNNLNDILLEEIEDNMYSEKTYEMYHLYYFKHFCTLLTQNIDELINQELAE